MIIDDDDQPECGKVTTSLSQTSSIGWSYFYQLQLMLAMSLQYTAHLRLKVKYDCVLEYTAPMWAGLYGPSLSLQRHAQQVRVVYVL